ncbi:hypothetical protein G7B40_031050 [Aetokthonos hydrillicola Thurmond2011]|jgi:hypothetical protein|uniref:Uncharacterized protein n=1 Tax=Aetokthonos hydrillicola Thurmond2011 TaxID=2712845 RepID=A0AAP5IFY5_9CYAN|nr:hypothetical protein [Aetokthonos hydrillicola]MBO3462115.1 hypothetical protein [Aetokthonos hydrillicola CCALA 1050]MBW4589709.1 hypothetical protein [Aetokthonos hydrillicola CCALA 1050]MDR9898963.1 hypothetical protein [Aetokthonos hydrillicola Thurmond2011]
MNYCPFSETQLNFLIEVNNKEDWRAECFSKVLRQHRDDTATKLSSKDFEDLIHKINNCPPEITHDLQIALSILSAFPGRIYFAGNTQLPIIW